jgi:hypothetical protein
MTRETQNRLDHIITRLIEKFGKQNQVLVCVEELAELQKVLLKNIVRGEDNETSVLEELVDVYIMSTQIGYIFGFDNIEFESLLNKKLDRMAVLIDSSNSE